MNKGQLESIAGDLERGLTPDEVLFKYRLTTYEINNLIGQLKPNSALARRLRSFVSNARLSISSPNTGRFGSGGEANLEAELLTPRIISVTINANGSSGFVFFNTPVRPFETPKIILNNGANPAIFIVDALAEIALTHELFLEEGDLVTAGASVTGEYAPIENEPFDTISYRLADNSILPAQSDIPVTNNSTRLS